MHGSVRVLLVDDEQMVRDNLEAFLEDEGLMVTASESAEKGLSLLGDRRFDVAIVDMRLPGMSGDEFIRQALARATGMQFLIHTGSLEYSLADDLMVAGLTADHILHKPLADMNHLTERLAWLCR